MEHFRGQPAKLKHKYLNELHANEVAILPYYVANLNIEATYAAITGNYEEFPNLCFVDTLDNVGVHTSARGITADIFGSISEENVFRIKRQNSKRISVIVGNPPYRANQKNENDNNKNRGYQKIDHQIRQTYVANSKAQKTKAYDPFVRFFRWASNRLKEDGIIAFITNRAFIDKEWADGFRKVVAEEFSEIYLVDLGADIRANPKLSGTRHNVFGIQTGVAISFMVKRTVNRTARIFYVRRPEMETAEEKLHFLANNPTRSLSFEEVQPDRAHNWINVSNNDFGKLLPLANKETKVAKTAASERAIFKIFSLGSSTNRDEWVIDFDESILSARMHWFCIEFAKAANSSQYFDHLKWSRNLKRRMAQGRLESFDAALSKPTIYRPFVKAVLYDSTLFIDERGETDVFFPRRQTRNPSICVIAGDRQQFSLVASNVVPNLNLYSADATKYVGFHRYDNNENREDNITDWGLHQFTEHYRLETRIGRNVQEITKEAIFHYCYAVLHDPLYREKYALNLKREFPRIPFYANFWQ